MRTNRVNKARKAPGTCSRCGTKIKKGEPYFWIKGRRGPKKIFCGNHRPRDSEKTGSDKLSQLYAARESVEDLISNDASRDDLVGGLRDAAQTARDVGEEYRASKDNMPENLQASSKADELDEKADQCDQWADELEQAADDIEGMEDWDAEAKEAAEGENPDDAVDIAEDNSSTKMEAEDRANDALGALEL